MSPTEQNSRKKLTLPWVTRQISFSYNDHYTTSFSLLAWNFKRALVHVWLIRSQFVYFRREVLNYKKDRLYCTLSTHKDVIQFWFRSDTICDIPCDMYLNNLNVT